MAEGASARSGTAVLEALATGCYYASTGPRIYDVRRDGDAVEVRCSPCRIGHARLRRRTRGRGKRGPARLPPAGPASSSATRPGSSSTHGWTCPPSARARPRRGNRCRGKEGVGEPASGLSARPDARRARCASVRPSRHRRRDHRRRNRRPRRARGPRRRTRRRRRLRRCNLERVLEAHPRRAALPPPRGCRPRAGGAPRAAPADDGRRPAPRPPNAVPASPLPRRAVPTGVRPERNRRLLGARALAASTGSSHPPTPATVCRRSGSRGSGLARSTRTRPRTTRASASRTSAPPPTPERPS